jgi:PAS domain S-box-containing protein
MSLNGFKTISSCDLDMADHKAISITSTQLDELASNLEFDECSSIDEANEMEGTESGIETPSPKKLQNAPMIQKDFTTLMISGIPCCSTQESLLDWIDRSGFQGKYDFFHLPCESSGEHIGHAFINLVHPLHARSLQSMLNGAQLDPRNSAKVCRIYPASIQGLSQLQKHFSNDAIDDIPHDPSWFFQIADHSAEAYPGRNVNMYENACRSFPLTPAGIQRQTEVKKMVDVLSVLNEVDYYSQSITVCSTEDDCPFTFVSTSFEKLTGYKKKELLGRNMRILNGEKDMSTEQRMGLAQACMSGSPFQTVLQCEHKDGSKLRNLLDLRTLEIGVYAKNGDPFRVLIGIHGEISETFGFGHWMLVMPDIVADVLQQVTSAVDNCLMLFGEEIVMPLEKPFWVEGP